MFLVELFFLCVISIILVCHILFEVADIILKRSVLCDDLVLVALVLLLLSLDVVARLRDVSL